MSEEMFKFFQDEDLDYTYIEGSTPSLDQMSYASIPDDTVNNDSLMEPKTTDIQQTTEVMHKQQHYNDLQWNLESPQMQKKSYIQDTPSRNEYFV